MEDFGGAKFYCPRALADGNQCIQIREKTLEFSSAVLSTMSPGLNLMTDRKHVHTRLTALFPVLPG